MITALSIKIPEKKKGLRSFADKLRSDRVEAEDKTAGSVTLRHIVYTSYSGELKLERLNSLAGVERCRLLCSERLIFPRQSGYRRFCSTAFSSRLCTNFALGVLKSFKNAADLRVAIYDPAAYWSRSHLLATTRLPYLVPASTTSVRATLRHRLPTATLLSLLSPYLRK